MASWKKKPARNSDVSSISSGMQDLAFDDFPLKMIKDKKTEMYVKFAKVMVICQGPYSQIRSDALKRVKNQFAYASCVLSDESYSQQRNTICSVDGTEDFYEYLRSESRKALEEGHNLLVIDSTMSDIKQNKYFLALALKMQYVVLIVPPVVSRSDKNHFWPNGSQALSYKKVGTNIQPCNMFQHLFCAWFLHDIDSIELRHEAGLYVQDCFENIPEFKQVFSQVCETYVQNSSSKGKKIPHDDDDNDDDLNFSDMSNMELFNHYFKLEKKRQDLSYCVMKVFPNVMRSMNEYFKKQSVNDLYGKMSKLYISGFLVTPNMIAARVKLTHKQKDLWEMDDELDEDAEISVYPSDLLSQSKNDLKDVEVQLICSKSNQSLINTKQTVHEPIEGIHPFAMGRSCHFLLARADNAPARKVDYEVAFALRREKKAMKEKTGVIIEELERCVVKKVGRYWFIYLRETLCVDGFFSSCCKAYPFENAIR